MSGPTATQRTPLYDEHLAAGGRMVAFAGWEMPVQYRGVIDEHLAVRRRAGLFDVSHMGEAEVRGRGALDFLQWVTCNDVGRLSPGRAQYTALLTPAGGFVDDLLVYMRDEASYLLVINAANTAKDVRWLEQEAQRFDVTVRDVSPAWAQLALQGPEAEAILDPLVARPLAGLKSYRFFEGPVCEAPCLVSRTGYTGEDGFEIYAPASAGARIWRELLAAGRERGVEPVGLGARDTLRLEARLALYGNDIDDTTSPLEADLGWIVKWDKGAFNGREALERQRREGTSRKLVGFEMRSRAIARHGYTARHASHDVGRVTSGSFAPFLSRNIGLAYLPLELAVVGTEFAVRIRERDEPACVVATPFYRRAR